MPPRGWGLKVYPEAGEAGGAWRSGRERDPAAWVAPGSAADPERSEQQAARRARGGLRRYCAAHCLNRFGTLTYAGEGCHSIDEHLANVAGFYRRLRRGLSVERIPYARVWEWHPGGHGLHEHFAVGRYVSRSLIDDAWGLGRVHIKLIGDLPVGSTVRQEARQAARYMAPYLSKGGGDRPMGRHRYEVAQGYEVKSVQLLAPSAAEALDAACAEMGGAPEHVTRSDDWSDYEGPPALWAVWP